MKINHQSSGVRAQRNLDGMPQEPEKPSQGFLHRRKRFTGVDETALHLGAHLHSQIRGLEQERRDLGDGITAIQTADRAMLQMSDLLLSMKEQALEVSAGGLLRSTRQNLQQDFKGSTTRLGQIANATRYRGQALLDGTANAGISFRMSQGLDKEQITITISDLRPDKLGTRASGMVDRQNLSSPQAANRAIRSIDEALEQIVTQRIDLQYTQGRLDSSIADLGKVIERLMPGASAHLREPEEAQRVIQSLQKQIAARPKISVLSQANQTQQTALTLLLG